MAVIGTGAAVTYQSGLFAEILSLEWTGITRDVYETTHMGTTGGKTYGDGNLYDPGELSVELAFDNPDGGWITAMLANPETTTVTVSNGNTWAASGFMSEFEWSAPLEDRMVATATIKLSGGITLAAS